MHILSELLSLGCHYHSLHQFIVGHRDAANNPRNSQEEGIVNSAENRPIFTLLYAVSVLSAIKSVWSERLIIVENNEPLTSVR